MLSTNSLLGYLTRPKPRLSRLQRGVIKTCLHFLITGYLAIVFYLAASDQIAGDPVEALLEFSGIGAVNLLIITLAVSPLARGLKFSELMNFRRLFGVYAFVYAAMHVLTFVAFELQFDMALVVAEIIKRPYITVGMAAFSILFALAVTSPMLVRKKMGRQWLRLHQFVYLGAALALLHFSWSQKTALQEPLLYWAAFVVLMWPRFRLWRNR